MSSLRLLAFTYLAAASAYSMAVVGQAHPVLGRDFAAGMTVLVRLADRHVVAPALDRARRQDAALIDSLDHPATFRLTIRPLKPGEIRILPRIDKPQPVAQRAVAVADDHLSDPTYAASASVAILPDLSPEAAPVPPIPQMPEPRLASPRVPHVASPDFDIASAIPQPPAPHVGNRAEAAALRLKASLTPELAQNFDLFIFVSKAERGPLAQRMYVFRKQDGQLKLLYDWAASTGREQEEVSPRGRSGITATPAGFYEFDPDRMYRRYHSYNWDQDMPDAMFFNWEREGVQTGLAIHSATGADIARLGSRASAGCVHLSPENAATLFRLVKQDYRGQMPRFAVNRATDTMSNTGALLRDKDGQLRMTDGYRVLIDIENYSGADTLAALN
jgi:lipoprotein-anchoring transpeptidase ErfK/SrfK